MDFPWMVEYTEYTLSILCIRGAEMIVDTRTGIATLYKDGDIIAQCSDEAMWSLWDYAKWGHEAGKDGDDFAGYQNWKVKNIHATGVGYFVPPVMPNGDVMRGPGLKSNELAITAW